MHDVILQLIRRGYEFGSFLMQIEEVDFVLFQRSEDFLSGTRIAKR